MTISPMHKEPLPIRLVFKLERDEHPRLYDELIRFRKGAKRVNRLRLLAYEGLLAQNVLLVRDGMAARADAHGAGAEEGVSAVTNDLFAPGIEAAAVAEVARWLVHPNSPRWDAANGSSCSSIGRASVDCLIRRPHDAGVSRSMPSTSRKA